MYDPFDVDDILEEIKKKKESHAVTGHTMAQTNEPPASAWPTATSSTASAKEEDFAGAPPPRVNPSAIDGLADFFGEDVVLSRGGDKPREKTRAKANVPPAEPAPQEPAPEKKDARLDLDRWLDADEYTAPAKGLDKTQLSIPLDKVKETYEAQSEEELGKTQMIAPQKITAADQFDFASLQQKLKEQETVDDPDADARDEFEEIDDFDSPADIPHIKHDLKNTLAMLNLKTIVVLLSLAGCFYFMITRFYQLPMPGIVSYSAAPVVYMIVQMVLVVICALVCNTVVGGGLAALFTMHADVDSLTALSVIACIIQGVALVVFSDRVGDQAVGLFFVPVLLGLLFNLWGKKLLVRRIDGNFKRLTSEQKKSAVLMLKNRDLARELSRGLDLLPPNLAYSCGADFYTNFLEESYDSDASEGVFRIITPIIAIGSLIIAGVSYYLNRDIVFALSAFAAVVSISSPLTAALAANLPAWRGYKKLAKEGCGVTGPAAVAEFSEANGILVDANDLFPSENVVLHNIKMFQQQRIDEAILDASSVLASFDGTVKSIFMKIIQGKMEMLKPVENVVYEEGMGISAWVDGKRVLIGNSALMRHHEVYTPSGDYESKYKAEGQEVLYLANSGELTAMFVVSYRPDPAIADELYRMERKGVALIVKSNDPNLTNEKIAEVYELPVEMVQVISAKLHGEFDLLKVKKDTVRAGIFFTGKVATLFHSVTACITMRSAAALATVLQTVGMILGYGLMSVFVLLGSMEYVHGLTVAGFGLLWGAATLLFANLRRI